MEDLIGVLTRVAGDITTPVGSKFPFTIECKKEKDGTWIRLLRYGQVEKWWTQCIRDSERVGLSLS